MSYIDTRWHFGYLARTEYSNFSTTSEPWHDMFGNPSKKTQCEEELNKIWKAMRTSVKSLMKVITVVSSITIPSNSMPSFIDAVQMLKKQPPDISSEMMPFVDELMLKLQSGGACASFSSGRMLTVTAKDNIGLTMNIYRPDGLLEVSLEDNGPNGADGVIGIGTGDIITREKAPLGLRYTSIDGFNDNKPRGDQTAYQKYLRIMAESCTLIPPSKDS